MGLACSTPRHSEEHNEALEAYIKLGNALLRQHKLPEAMEAFQQAAKLDDTSLEAHIGRFRSTRDTTEHSIILEQLLKLYPDNLWVLDRVCYLESLLGNNEKVDATEKAIIDSTNTHSVMDYVAKYGAYAGQNDNENALKMLDKAISLDKKDPYLYFKKAVLIHKINPKEALKYVETAVRLDPLFCDAWSLKGDILAGMEQYEEGFAAYDKALEIDPYDIDTLNNKASECSMVELYKESLELALRIIAIDPKNDSAYSIAATASKGLGNLDKALEYRNKSIELAPDDEFNYLDRGNLYLKCGQKEEAHADFTKGYELFKAHGENIGTNGDFIEKTLSARDALIEEFSKLAQTEDIKPVVVSEGQDAKAVTALNTQILEVNTAKQELISEATEVMNPQAKSGDDALAAMQQQMAAMIATIMALQSKVTELESTTAKKTEVSYAIRVNFSQETMADNMTKIKDDTFSYTYYEAFTFALNAAYGSSAIIVNGQVALDTPSSSLGAIAFATSFIPFVGNGIQSAVTSVGEVLKDIPVKQAAVKLSKMASGPVECDRLVLHIATRITLNPGKDAELHAPEAPAKAKGFWSSLTDKLSSLVDKATEMLEGDRYDSPHAKLGYRDAFKLVEKIGKGEIIPTADSDAFVDICCKVILGSHYVSAAGAAEEVFGFE